MCEQGRMGSAWTKWDCRPATRTHRITFSSFGRGDRAATWTRQAHTALLKSDWTDAVRRRLLHVAILRPATGGDQGLMYGGTLQYRQAGACDGR